MKPFGAIVLFVLAIAATGCWQAYAYQDCLKVGHSKVYCIMRMGK